MRKDPAFHQMVQDRFMLELENDIPSMVSALKREVLAGNVQATRLMFEYMNKLQKNINITIDSPFENWMKKQGIEEAEVVTDELPIMAEFKDLPPRGITLLPSCSIKAIAIKYGCSNMEKIYISVSLNNISFLKPL